MESRARSGEPTSKRPLFSTPDARQSHSDMVSFDATNWAAAWKNKILAIS